jgi:ACT domain-containing protein
MGKIDWSEGCKNTMTKSIIKRQSVQKKDLLEKLKETPVVEVACRKIGIARATYYRWRINDEKFAKEAELALEAGSALVNDMAESQLLTAIKDQNMTAIIYWLNHHHPTYATKIEVTANLKNQNETLTPEQEALVTKALQLASLIPAIAKDEKEEQK